jgi:hypothetical protein
LKFKLLWGWTARWHDAAFRVIEEGGANPMAERRQLSRRRMESMFAVVLWAIGKAVMVEVRRWICLC